MKTRQRLAVQYFLRTLENKMLSQKVPWINPVWKVLFTKAELLEIVKWLYLHNIPEGMDMDNMDEDRLLDAIGDEYLILRYLLEQFDKDLEDFMNPDRKSVSDTLEQLGMENHYLGEIPPVQWDKYDKANYNALCRKAGKTIPFFGVFNSEVKEKDKYLLPPLELHESEWNAQAGLFLLMATSTDDKELKIMKL